MTSKVKIYPKSSAFGFIGFHSTIPNSLRHLFIDDEWTELISKVNSYSKTKMPLIGKLSILLLPIGIGLVIAGFVQKINLLWYIGFGIIGGFILLYGLSNLFVNLRMHGNINKAIKYANKHTQDKNLVWKKVMRKNFAPSNKVDKKTGKIRKNRHAFRIEVSYPKRSNTLVTPTVVEQQFQIVQPTPTPQEQNVKSEIIVDIQPPQEHNQQNIEMETIITIQGSNNNIEEENKTPDASTNSENSP